MKQKEDPARRRTGHAHEEEHDGPTPTGYAGRSVLSRVSRRRGRAGQISTLVVRVTDRPRPSRLRHPPQASGSGARPVGTGNRRLIAAPVVARSFPRGPGHDRACPPANGRSPRSYRVFCHTEQESADSGTGYRPDSACVHDSRYPGRWGASGAGPTSGPVLSGGTYVPESAGPGRGGRRTRPEPGLPTKGRYRGVWR